MSTTFSPDPLPLRTLAVVGVGLIGGSIAAGAKKRNVAARVIGVGRNAKRLDAARTAGLIDAAATDVAQAAAEADLIVFCTPVDLIVDGARAAAETCRPGTLVTDAGSVKEAICRKLSTGLPDGVTFIGSHPLAGSEKTGFEHANPDLYVGRTCVITPEDSAGEEQVARLRAFWQALGMSVVTMTAADHDRALAETSHLPHVVAAALAAQLNEADRRLTASGFRDTTRIAAGAPSLWVGILLNNAEEIVKSLDGFSDELARFRKAIANRDAAALQNLLQIAKTNRDALS